MFLADWSDSILDSNAGDDAESDDKSVDVFYSEEAKVFAVGPAVLKRKEVYTKNMGPEDRERFRVAIQQEWDTITGAKAAKALSVAESEKVR